MNTVFDPEMLFIEENLWHDESTRDEFLSHLGSNLTTIDTYRFTKIYWTDEFESFLWAAPQIPPWRLDKDWANALVPFLYRIFTSNITLLEVGNVGPCTITPSLNSPCGTDIFSCFLWLMHKLIGREEDVFLCLGVGNRLSGYSGYVFHCDCHSCSLTPVLVRKADDWLDHIDVEHRYWPSSVRETDIVKEAMELIRRRKLDNRPFLYSCKFTRRFMGALVGTKAHRKQILESMSKRLTLSKQQAAVDGGLRDEAIERRNEHRFRVTRAARIHYRFSKSNEIEFLEYYEESQHDDGL